MISGVFVGNAVASAADAVTPPASVTAVTMPATTVDSAARLICFLLFNRRLSQSMSGRFFSSAPQPPMSWKTIRYRAAFIQRSLVRACRPFLDSSIICPEQSVQIGTMGIRMDGGFRIGERGQQLVCAVRGRIGQ